MDCQEVANIMGINQATVHRYYATGKFRCERLNRKIFIRKKDIDALFDNAEPYEVMPVNRAPITEFYTMQEITEKFEVSESTVYNIIKKYQMKCFGEYLLPIFTHKHQTPDQQAGRIKRISEQTNRTLRKVCAQLGIEAEITLGSTRKIFITHMIDSRIPYEHIAEYVGCTIDTVIRHHEQFYQAVQEAWIQYSPDKK